MKKIFRLCNYFAACVFIFYISTSCKVASITITSSNTTNGELTLKDSRGNSANVFDTVGGQRIKFIINEGSAVSSIIFISEKKDSDNILRRRFHKKFLSKSWKGRIEKIEVLREKFKDKVTPEGYIIEEYFIIWEDETGKRYIYDPRIQVKS